MWMSESQTGVFLQMPRFVVSGMDSIDVFSQLTKVWFPYEACIRT